MVLRLQALPTCARFLCFLCVVHLYRTSISTTIVWFQQKTFICRDFHWSHNILDEITRPAGPPWIVNRSGRRRRQHHERKQKWTYRAGLLTKLRKQPLKPPLPSLYLSITRDHEYSNLKSVYRAIPLPHLGQSDHVSLFLSPAYTPLSRQTKPKRLTITTWPDYALP